MKTTEELKALRESITREPWVVTQDDEGHVIEMGTAIDENPYKPQHRLEYRHGCEERGQRDQFDEAEANATLMGISPNLLSEVIQLREERERLSNELHQHSAHPDYEYTDSVTGRKQSDILGQELEADGWELNTALFSGGFFRDDFTDTRYWRRLLSTNPTPDNG